MITAQQVNFRKDSGPGLIDREVLDVRDRIKIVYRDVIKAAEIPVRPPLTICNGEAHGLLEHQTMPKHSMLANSSEQ